MAGKIPTTKRIELASNTEQWTLIENGLINELPCSGTIERSNDSKIKIQLILTSVLSPKNHKWKGKVLINGNSSKEMKNGLERIMEFFDNLCNQKIWIISGYINGTNKVPILIIHYELFNTSVYTIKFKKESFEDFLPSGVLPSLN